MPEPQFKKIEVPRGQFIGWGKLGQSITIDVLDYDDNGGTDFNGNLCPLLTGTAMEDTYSFRDKGTTRVEVKRGELVSVTCGQANLRKGIKICDPSRGDLVRLTYTETYETAKGDGKVIEVEHAPGAGTGGSARAAAAQDDSVGEDDL